MRLASIPAGAPFLDIVAQRWMDAHGGDDLARGLILLPTRRAARSLAEAFLRVSNGKPLLLPRITALGAIDEAPLALAGALDLAPAVEPSVRLSVLSSLILKLPSDRGGVATADRAWRLARELAALMDEADRMELDLPSALAKAADAEHAEHWRVTLDFLAIVTRAWPAWLADNELENPARRQSQQLRAQARAWEDAPPAEPVWAAGVTAGGPAETRLLKVVAELPGGQVILPGLDTRMDSAAWSEIGDSHPQAGMARLLKNLGATREDVSIWGEASPRSDLLSTALLPAKALGTWRAERPTPDPALSRLEAADAQEEAVAIALTLRDALERPGARAALVTPDRALAGRVTAELLRWGVVADDSAGEPLAESPPAVFLRLLAAAVADGLGPVTLLALLKHPLAAAGVDPAACRRAARLLEREALRGPRPRGGIVGLRAAIARKQGELGDFLDRLEACLQPLLRVATAPVAAPVDMLTALVAAGEALTTTDDTEGPTRLWAMEEGESLATALADAIAAATYLPDQPPTILPGLLDAILEGIAVRSRRALRGRDGAGEHPRVFIWGLLEARLQSVDVAVLGGLVEGVWPPATDPGPWMSRPMRANAGFPSPEERVGQAAHDFALAACMAPATILSCPRRRDGAPAVPARWLVRLDALLAGAKTALPRHPAAVWARALDQPIGPPCPVTPPAPRPPLHLRPNRLSVTEIQTWLEDPYAIHARHVLELRKLKELEEQTDAADYGTIVHAGMQHFLTAHPDRLPADASREVRRAMERALSEAGLRQALTEWWRPRLARIADWVAEQEAERRGKMTPARILTERPGRWDRPDGFTLTGRADRIERRGDGAIAIFDYKTGQPPSQKSVEAGFAAQLPLEAAMAAAGAFGPDATGTAAELVYWHLTGGFEPGKALALYRGDPTAVADGVARAAASLAALILAYRRPDRAYLAQPHPGRVVRFSDYAHLARVAEWSAAGEDP